MAVVSAYVLPHPPLAVPDVGRGKEAEIPKTIGAYKAAAKEIAALRPETVVIVSPHSVLYADYFHISPPGPARGDMTRFGARGAGVALEYDETFINALTDACAKQNVPAGTLGEKNSELDHACVIPLYFILKEYADFKLVRLSVSGLSLFAHYDFGRVTAQAAEEAGRKTVFIASGDMSHKLNAGGPYGFAAEGPKFDKIVTDALKGASFAELLLISETFAESAGECGLRPLAALAGVLHKKAVVPTLLSYECPYGVGYAAASFGVSGASDAADHAQTARNKAQAAFGSPGNPYARFARLLVETYIKTDSVADIPDWLPQEALREKAGVFVSIKKDGELRGCVGTISPTRGSVAREIQAMAVSAAVNDSRFFPITADELPRLTYSVDVLRELEPVSDISELDVKKYGVVVRNKNKKGLLLPNLDGVDTAEAQVEIAKQKAGIAFGEEFVIERFEVVRHK